MDGACSRILRDPAAVAELLSAGGLPSLPVLASDSPPPPDGQWMMKPIRGAAGRGIEIWEPSARNSLTCGEDHYFQQRQDGIAISALYLASPGRTRLLGVSRQSIGQRELHAGPFAYCGSLAPWPMPEENLEQIRRIGEVLGTGSGAQGLFGADFLFDGITPWLTEVNPRYTASAELFEHLYQTPLLDWHRRACLEFENRNAARREDSVSDSEISAALENSLPLTAGKVILYAREHLETPLLDHLISSSLSFDSLPQYGDLPPSGSRIRPGEPICTLLGLGSNPNACLAELLERAGELERKLLQPSSARRFS